MSAPCERLSSIPSHVPYQPDSQVTDGLLVYSAAAGAAAIIIGASVLVGWHAGSAMLKCVLTSSKAMNPVAAAASVLTGFSLCLLRRERSLPLVWLGRACAGVVLGAALLKLAGPFVYDLHVDQWFFREKLESTTPPNHICLNSTINLVLVSTALLLLDVRTLRGICPSQVLGAVAAGIGMFGLTDHVYGARELPVGLAGNAVMAFNSALTWTIVGTGILCARPDRGLMQTISSTGGAGRTVRRLLPAAVLLPLLLGWLELMGRRAGLYDAELGMTWVAMAMMAIFSLLIWWNGNSLRALDFGRRRAEVGEALRLEEARKEALLQLNQMTEASLREITDFALEEGVRLTRSKIGYLAFLDEDESALTMHSWSKTAMRQCAMIDRPIVYPIVSTGLLGEPVRQRKPVITDDYAAPNPLKKGYPEGHVPVRRHLSVPVFDGRKIVIVAGVGNKQDPYEESDVRQLTLLMQGMWRLIQRMQTAAHLAREHAVIDGINAIFQKALTCNAVEEVARTCLAAAQQITQSPYGFLGGAPTRHPECLAGGGAEWEPCRVPQAGSEGLLRDMEARGTWDQVYTQGHFVILNDPPQIPIAPARPRVLCG